LSALKVGLDCHSQLPTGGGEKFLSLGRRSRAIRVSGTTLAAAELTECVCLGMELDPKYADVAVLRWQGRSNQQARLDGDGRTFDAIKTERMGIVA
jgi:hypothetical protein